MEEHSRGETPPLREVVFPQDSEMAQDRTIAREQGDFLFALEPGAHAPAQARRELAARLRGGLPQSLVDDVLLLTTELVTNSVRHAPETATGSIDVSVVYRPSTIRVEVTDPGEGFAHVRQRPGALSEGGRGLFLVEALADRWGKREGGNTTVWYELGVERGDEIPVAAAEQVTGAGLAASASVSETSGSAAVDAAPDDAELTSDAAAIAAELRALASATESLDEQARSMETDLARVADTLKAGAERLRARRKLDTATEYAGD
jgi:anti-sigma regulatory factor (Ser/Thr protein kinase)